MMFAAQLALGIGGLLAVVWPWSGAPGVEVVKLSVPESCKAGDLIKEKKTVKGSDRDVLVWRVTNECSSAVNVAITPATAPFSCVGEPKWANVGTPFSLEGNQRAYIVCAIDYASLSSPTTYPFAFSFVLTAQTGANTNSSGMNAVPAGTDPTDERPRASEIAIEVDP